MIRMMMTTARRMTVIKMSMVRVVGMTTTKETMKLLLVAILQSRPKWGDRREDA